MINLALCITGCGTGITIRPISAAKMKREVPDVASILSNRQRLSNPIESKDSTSDEMRETVDKNFQKLFDLPVPPPKSHWLSCLVCGRARQ